LDKNKLQKLRKIKYKICGCCGNCSSGKFTNMSLWGVCLKNFYLHMKHAGGSKGSNRNLSINYFGYCPDHEFKENFKLDLQLFKEFTQEEKD